MGESGRAEVRGHHLRLLKGPIGWVEGSRDGTGNKASTSHGIARVQISASLVDVEPPVIHIEGEAPNVSINCVWKRTGKVTRWTAVNPRGGGIELQAILLGVVTENAVPANGRREIGHTK